MHVLIAALHRPSKPTGVCRHASGLARCLASLDNVTQITLVIGEWQREYFESVFPLSSPKIKLIDIDIKNSSFSRNIWFVFGLPKLTKKLKPDLLHLSFPLPFIRAKFPCPVVTSIHDLYAYEFPENFGYLKANFNRFFFQRCLKESDGLTCVSQHTAERLSYHFPELENKKKINVTYNFVDFDDIEPQKPDFLPTEYSSPFILTVAQHRKNKNLDLLLLAYSQLIEEQCVPQSVSLILVGSTGPETPALLHLVRDLKLQKQVHWLSSISDSELQWLYQNSSLFVVPSATEGFCVPLAEALYFSCQCVSSDIPVLREIGENQCNYFKLEGDSVRNLKSAIAKSLLEGSAKILPSSEFKFSKSSAGQSYLKFYRETLG